MKSHRPCPRCLIPKAEFPNLGIPEDQRRRKRLKRIDDNARNNLVAQARSIIYTEGLAVNSGRVELLLKPHSYTPTAVSYARSQSLNIHLGDLLTFLFLRMLSRADCDYLALTFSTH
jgi:hypothetical protein